MEQIRLREKNRGGLPWNWDTRIKVSRQDRSCGPSGPTDGRIRDHLFAGHQEFRRQVPAREFFPRRIRGCESSEGPEPPCFCANHLQGAWWWDSGPRIISTELAGLSAKLASHPCSLAISADEHCKRNGQWRRQTGRLGRSYVTKATDLRDSATCFALRGRRGSGVRRSEGEKA